MRRTTIAVLLILASWSGATAQVPQVERDALIALYNSTNGVGWSNSDGWLGPEGTECTWQGVGCSSGHVSALYLYSNGLDGNIPPEFGDLSELVIVYLDSNQLDGTIPLEIGNLANLHDLRLGANELSGAIPASLGSLSELTVLTLQTNQLTGSIPPELGGLSNVQNFYLHGNQLTGSIPPELGNLANASHFDLSANDLSGTIPPELENLVSVEYLHLNANRLDGSIPAELGNLPNVLKIRLYLNRLTGQIPPELGDITSLTSLDLNTNLLEGPIPPEIGNLANLDTLRVERNRLSGAIPPELGSLLNLERLFLEHNPLEGSIPAELGSLTNLQFLHLDGTMLSGSLPPELANLTALNDGNGLNLSFDALYCDDASLVAFLNSKQNGGDWEWSQTVAPENVVVEWVGDHTAMLSWDAVTYQNYPGGYEAFVAPVGSGQWGSAGRTHSKTDLGIPVSGLEAGESYDFAIATYTLPNQFNFNTVISDLGSPEMATTSSIGCAEPEIVVSWDQPPVLSLAMSYDSYEWSTGEISATILADPNNTRYYWVVVTGPGPCNEAAMVLFDPVLFVDDFESGSHQEWSQTSP